MSPLLSRDSVARRRLTGTVLSVCAAAVLAAGCGSSNSTSSSSSSASASNAASSGNSAVQQASAAVATAMQNPTGWHGPTTPARAPKGKKIVVLSCDQATSGCSTVAEEAVNAAKKLGWSTTLLDGKDSPDTYNADIKQAITLKADGLDLVGVSESLVGDSIKQAKAAGIKVVSSGVDNQPGTAANVVDADVREPNDIPGQWIADWMIKQTNGKAKVLALNLPEFSVIGSDLKYFEAQLKSCSGCSVVKEMDVNLASAATSLAQQVEGLLQANPDVNYVYMPVSDLLPYVQQAIQAVNKTGQISVADTSCQLPGPVSMRKHGVETACVAVPYHWLGWASIDLMVRLMDGQHPTWTSETPMKLLTASNVFPTGEFWDGGYPFQQKYEQLWGVA